MCIRDSRDTVKVLNRSACAASATTDIIGAAIVNSINKNNVSLSLNLSESSSDIVMTISYDTNHTINSNRVWQRLYRSTYFYTIKEFFSC